MPGKCLAKPLCRHSFSGSGLNQGVGGYQMQRVYLPGFVSAAIRLW